MRLTAIFLFATMLTACRNSDAPATKNDASTSAKENITTVQWLDSAHNYGNIAEGQKLALSFRVKNTGSAPLIIKSVTPTCGCTVANYPKQPIPTGQEGEITGIFDSNHKEGLQQKHITIQLNTNPAFQDISFEVNVTPNPNKSSDDETNQ
jgi:hypothetical protein